MSSKLKKYLDMLELLENASPPVRRQILKDCTKTVSVELFLSFSAVSGVWDDFWILVSTAVHPMNGFCFCWGVSGFTWATQLMPIILHWGHQCYFSSENHFYFSFYLVHYKHFFRFSSSFSSVCNNHFSSSLVFIPQIILVLLCLWIINIIFFVLVSLSFTKTTRPNIVQMKVGLLNMFAKYRVILWNVLI